MGSYDLTSNAYYQVSGTVFSAVDASFSSMNSLLGQLTSGTDAADISEIDMMRLNVAVSKFNTMVNLASGIFKNLCDGEKVIAQKM